MEKWGMPLVLGDLIRQRAEEVGDKVFLRYKDEQVTYREVDLYSNRCANGFLNLGIKKGDHVAIMLPNCPEFIYTWFGLSKIGAVEVTVNTFHKGEFLRYNIDQSDSRMLVIHSDYLERMGLIQDQLPKLEKVIVVGGIDEEKAKAMKIPLMSFEELFERSSDKAVDIEVFPWDPISIIYTSGTTGPSKGVLAPHKMWIVDAKTILEYRDGREDDVFYAFMPLYHYNAQVLSTITVLVAKAQLVLAERFSASRFWDEMRKYGVTQINYLGGVMPILAKQPERPDDADNPVRVGIGAACPPEVMDYVESRFGITCMEGYGMTETGLPIHVTLQERRPGTCGKVIGDLFEVKLFDDHDEEVPVGHPGEIVVRPKEPYIMLLQYYKMPEKTLEAFRNLWFHTGDLAKKDEEGYFYFVDRKKDAIRRRGENISSFEVEKVVNSHPAVLESAAIAIPSELGEDEIKICVVLKPREKLTPEELIRWCDERMPYFAVPRYVEFMDSLPKTPTERVEKYKLRQMGITPNTWDREEAGIKITR